MVKYKLINLKSLSEQWLFVEWAGQLMGYNASQSTLFRFSQYYFLERLYSWLGIPFREEDFGKHNARVIMPGTSIDDGLDAGKKFTLNGGGNGKTGGRVFSKLSLGSLSNNVKIVDSVPAEVANNWWKDVMNYSHPPYLPDSDVDILTVTKKTKFVRVYDGEVSGQYGGWLMNPDDIKGLTPEQIRDIYALPATPKYITDVIIEPRTKTRTGIVNAVNGWGAGGARQYDLFGQRTGQFVNERPI